jgi:general secretion pathway protein I
LEVLVAFTILALTLGVLLQIFSKAMTVIAVSADYDRAVAVAETQLTRVGAEIPLESGVYSGETEDGIAWTVRVEGYPFGEEGLLEAAVLPFLVVAEVLWRDGAAHVRRFSLSSLRLGPPE